MANFAKTRAARESMEAADEVIDGISNVEPAEENLDVQLAEVASIDGQLDQLEADGETLAADTERTEDAIEQAEEAVANGEEMPEEAVALHEVAQESIARRWSLERTKLARESYRRGRGLTAAAQEGWKETLKGLYERFIQFCKEVIAKAKDLKLKYFNVGKTAQKRAKAYQEMLRQLGKQEKDKVSGGFITKLSIEGKFDVTGSIAIGKEVTAGKAKGSIAAMEKQAGEAVTAVKKGDDEAFKAMRGEQQVDLFGKVASKLHTLPNFEKGDASKLLALPGNAYIQSGTKELAGGQKFTAVAFLKTGDASSDKEVATPSVSEMATAASALEAIGKGFEAVLKDFRGYDEEIGKLQQAAEDATKALNNEQDNTKWEGLRKAREAANQSVQNYQTLNRAVSHVANTVISGLSGYIGAGIGAYKKSK
ncbi:hypothetical protein GAP86_18135 [Salmonella enterica]|nr:hypothetical protein [Salmonella enterica]